MARLTINYQELNTLLAALRIFQQVRAAGGDIPAHDLDLSRQTHRMTAQAETIAEMEHFADCEPLDDKAIDALAMKLDPGNVLKVEPLAGLEAGV